MVTNKSERYFSHLFLWFRFDDSIKDNFSSSFILIRMSLAALEALGAQGTEDDTTKKKIKKKHQPSFNEISDARTYAIKFVHFYFSNRRYFRNDDARPECQRTCKDNALVEFVFISF